MSTSVTRRVRDKDGKRRTLLEAATEVFAELGYEAALTKEIARRAECSESLIFRYFGDKQGIFESVVSRQIANAVAEAEDKVAESMPDDFVEYVEQLFLARLAVHGDVPGWEIAGRALSDPAFSVRLFLPNHERRLAVITKGVRHYQEAGQVSPNVDPAVLAELLANFIIMTTSLSPRFFGTPDADVMTQIEVGARIFAAGAKAPDGRGDGGRGGRVRGFRRFRAASDR